MHTKTDSESTSVDAASWVPRSPPRRPVYYVQSPSNHDAEKMSYGSGSPMASPTHPHYYHASPIHHSRESSGSRFSAPLKNQKSATGYKHLNVAHDGHRRHPFDIDDEDDDDDEMDGRDKRSRNIRLYLCLVLAFVVLFTVFALILWGASKAYKPKITVKGIVFDNFNVQAGSDISGVPTDMLTINSSVRILYKNPATFFAVHVTSTPLEFHYFQLKLASGQMEKFTQSRKSQRTIVTLVQANQVPLYGGVPLLSTAKLHPEKITLPMNLTFVVRSRAYILGRLVKSKFYTSFRCPVILRGDSLGKHIKLEDKCFDN